MVDALPLTKGKTEAQAIGAGGNFDLVGQNGDARIWVGGDSTLVVEVDMTGAANGDLAVVANPYEADGTTIMPVALPVVQSVGPTLNGGHVYYYAQIDVTGVDQCRVRITNNNAGGQTITRASWRLA
jgi:hypothetical protein